MNRAQRRAQAYSQRPRSEPFGGYPRNGVVRARGTSGRGNRTVAPNAASVKLRIVEMGDSA